MYSDEEVTNLAQSNSILRHVARAYNFYGKNNAERAYNDMFIDAAEDISNYIYRHVFTMDSEETRDKVRGELKTNLSQLEALLGDKDYFVGDGKCLS